MEQRMGLQETPWQQWFDRHGAVLLLIARQHTSSQQDAEDALQEGFVRFWRRREQANDPLSYLVRCVRNAALDASRSGERRQQREAASQTEQPYFQPHDPLVAEERRQSIETALKELPTEQSEVVVMKIWGEMTFAQIGEVLEISANTVASRYRYALGRLQSHLIQETRK